MTHVAKRPRGRPPCGAVLNVDGIYVLPAESVDIAAQRIVQRRIACRARYKATREALHIAKPSVFVF